MAKAKTAFFCQSCGYESPKWVGKCPSCGEWNSMVEETVVKSASKGQPFSRQRTENVPVLLKDIQETGTSRIQLMDSELNRVLGGGLVLGEIILIGGDPGIGKSTLLLQMAVKEQLRILYVSGEESEQQIKMRAERLGISNPNCHLLIETDVTQIIQHSTKLSPDLLIVDSIQTLFYPEIESAPGSVSQVRECTALLLRYAKESNVPVFLIGHITKEGSIAGPKVLEHMVDAVLQFEGDRNHFYRLLRTVKNRFGSTNELGIYEMQGTGLRMVENPSEILITNTDGTLSGSCIATTLEGLRPLQVEVQALVSTAAYGTPQRSSNGFDPKRLNMLLAVLEKRCAFRLAMKDVFLNIAGGIKVDDPAVDLAVIMAVLSSNADIPVNRAFTFAAEVGLSGEIRPINRIETRITEAQKLGYTHIFISEYNKGLKPETYDIQLIACKKLEEVVKRVFG
ncbi:MAG: DNA repair protein RadA [Flavobacteriia bacterium]|jgi:DNA repair protein RadA/Sms|nr:DNA repair protein RadA [Flavobacteriia bacterium]NBP28477.1 DNA repair protein RadA [Flavobacteriia bacterium]